MSAAIETAVAPLALDFEHLFRLYRDIPRVPALSHARERAFLLSLLPLWGNSPPRLCGAVDEDFAFALAEQHALTPALEPEFRAISPELGAQLREIRLESMLRHRLLLRDLTEIAAALDGAGIRYLVLKGAALLLRRPDLLGRRHLDDLDLWIPPDQLGRVEQLLLGLGARRSERDYNERRHPLCVETPRGTWVEIHVEPPSIGVLDALVEVERVPYEGRPITVPTERALLIHFCHHVLVQHAEEPRYLPRHLLDVAWLSPGARAELDDAPSVMRSKELLRLLRRAVDHPRALAALACFIFPTHHSALPNWFARERRLRDFRPRVSALRKLVFRVES